jgi:seryl-tRNA synthetase
LRRGYDFASALTYDFEVFSAAQDKWLEVSSVSNFETFQTNRMKIRFKDSNGRSQLVTFPERSSLALQGSLPACLKITSRLAELFYRGIA